jgi:peptide/nickel transport system ATP-binding protein
MSVTITDLAVYYQTLAGDVKALDGVSFTIADGEIMGLAGESGCGKSTLGTSLIRLDGRMRYIEGRVELDGIELPIWDSGRMNDFRFREISIVPQYAMSAMNPTRKIGRMVADLVEARGTEFESIRPELERRLELVGLSLDVLERYPIELSGGMKQRMVMVLSTLLDPSLLIADEITSALDVSSQKAVAETLVQFRDKGFVRSMIVITHDVSVLYQIADTITVMYAGKLAEKASTDVIIGAPRHPYTRLLISSLPEVGVRYADKRLTGIPGTPPSLLDPPTGCRFRARCPLAYERCAEMPPWQEIEPNHWVACWRVTGDDAAAADRPSTAIWAPPPGSSVPSVPLPAPGVPVPGVPVPGVPVPGVPLPVPPTAAQALVPQPPASAPAAAVAVVPAPSSAPPAAAPPAMPVSAPGEAA